MGGAPLAARLCARALQRQGGRRSSPQLRARPAHGGQLLCGHRCRDLRRAGANPLSQGPPHPIARPRHFFAGTVLSWGSELVWLSEPVWLRFLFFRKASQFESVRWVVFFLTLSTCQLSAERALGNNRFLGVSKARIFPADAQLSCSRARRLSAAVLCTEHTGSRPAGLLSKIQ